MSKSLYRLQTNLPGHASKEPPQTQATVVIVEKGLAQADGPSRAKAHQGFMCAF
jgi:hypothetical protein